MIQKMLIAKVMALWKIDCEDCEALNNDLSHSATGYDSLPVEWVSYSLENPDYLEDYSLTNIAQQWLDCFPHNNNVTLETLKARLAPWHATYKIVMAEWFAYMEAVNEMDVPGEEYQWFYEAFPPPKYN